jgi:hypothetical protein
VLRPQPIDHRGVLLNQFIGMSDTPFSYEDHEQARQENIDSINKSLTDSDKEFWFLLSKESRNGLRITTFRSIRPSVGS